MERIFGGSPAAVLLRLVIVSIIVGIVLRALHIRPQDLLHDVAELFYSLRFFGSDIFHWFLLGAIIVFPVWGVWRLLKLLGSK